MRGRKPESVVTGTGAVVEVPTPPTWLGKDSRAEWRRVCPIMITDRKTLTLADLATFGAYCSAVGEISEAARIIAKDGMIYQGASGPKKHPAVTIKSDAMTQARLLAGELGLTPTSRSRPAIREEGGHDADDDFDDSPIDDPLGYGERAVKFIRALKHPKTGKPFQLDRWQERIVRRIYGPRTDDGARIVRSVVMMIPRGGRKTTLGAALALLHTIGPEKVPYGQVVLAAYDRAQARIAFDEAHGIVMADPRIVAATRIVSSQHKITHAKSHATLRAASSDGAAANGKTPSFCLFDEIHCWKKRELFDVLRTGLGKTADTLSVVISQAGRGSENLAFEVFDYARKVAKGDIIDPGTLPILLETAKDADWRDEAVWHAANPGLSLGYPNLASLRQEALEAENRPALREKFKNDHLNIWLDHSETPFLPMETYDLGAKSIDFDALEGQPCWIGVDMSATTDLSAVVAAFHDGDGGYIVVPHFFCPASNLRARSDRDRVPYVQWADDGFITATAGDVIDYRAVEQCIRDLAERYQVCEIGFDRAYGGPVMSPLIDDGFPCVILQQGWVTQSPALGLLERAIVSRKFQHGGNPVLRWCFDNVAIHTDSAGNRTMHKGKSTDRIDGAAATWMAVSRAAAGDSASSIYNDETARPHGFLVFNF